MEPGFGVNLEGMLVKGNLSILPSMLPMEQGDGSLEGSGTLYFDTIREYNETFGVTIQDVAFRQEQLIVPYTLPSSSLSSASVILSGGISIGHTANATGLSSGGAITVAGGAAFGKNVVVGGSLNVTNNLITNVANPLIGTDAANKDYVDSVAGRVEGNFTTGQVIFGETDGTAIRGYPFMSLTNGNSLLSLGIPLSITDTTNANGTVAALIVQGGMQVDLDTIIGGSLDMQNNVITNVALPVNPSDAATKDYVDQQLSSSGNNINGSFTSGQLLVADTGGNTIRGYENLTFNLVDGTNGSLVFQNTHVALNSTTNAIGLGSGGTLDVRGGASFEGNVYIGNGLDLNVKRITNVADPIDPLDAVNKEYIDALFSINNTSETSVILGNNVVVPTDITGFEFDSTLVKAFVAYVYVENHSTNCSLYTLRGLYNGGSWLLSTTLEGQPILVRFYISDDGVIQYTNTSNSGITSIRYAIVMEIESTPGPNQYNVALSNNVVDVSTGETALIFSNSTINAVKLVMYTYNDAATMYNMTILTSVLRNGVWLTNTFTHGDNIGVSFGMNSQPSVGELVYTNTNVSGVFTTLIKVFTIQNSQDTYILNASTLTPTNIDPSVFVFGNNITSFQLTCYVDVPLENKSALYEVQGHICDSQWFINSRFIGDVLDVTFSISTSLGLGYLQYKNVGSSNANLRFTNTSQVTFDPPQSLPTYKGGTGQSYLEPYAILRGNGTGSVVATPELMYKNGELLVSETSKVVITNTEDASNISTGTLQTLGGIAVAKSGWFGGNLTVQGVNITPSVSDIFSEQSFNALNNQVVPQQVSGFIFSHPSTKSFTGIVCVTIQTLSTQLDALFDIKGLKKSSGWIISSTYLGDDVGIIFTIDSQGQVMYTSTNISQWVSTIMKYRALTTTN